MIQYRANGVTVFQSALFQTTSTVIEGETYLLVVDPTWLPQEVEAIRSFVATVRGGRRLYLLFTHSDWDHIIASAAFPDAVKIGSRALVERTDWQATLDQIHSFDNQNYLRRDYAIEYPSIDVVIDHDGQRTAIGDASEGAGITFYLAPGHTPCGLFSVVEPQGVLLAGDYLSDVEIPFIYDGSFAYETTVQKLDGLLEHHAVSLLVPGHGQSTTKVAEMRRRADQSLTYIAAAREAVRESARVEAAGDLIWRTAGKEGAAGSGSAAKRGRAVAVAVAVAGKSVV